MPRHFKMSALDNLLIEASVNGSSGSELQEETPLLEVPAPALSCAGLPPVKESCWHKLSALVLPDRVAAFFVTHSFNGVSLAGSSTTGRVRSGKMAVAGLCDLITAAILDRSTNTALCGNHSPRLSWSRLL